MTGMGATYEQWLHMIVGHGSSVSMVMTNDGQIKSGVAAQLHDKK